MGAQSRGAMRPGCACISRPKERGRRECRAPDAPAAACAMIVVERTRVSQVTPESPGIPRAMVLTVSFVLSPATGLSCHRRRRNCFHRLDAGVGASGPHDFAVRRAALSSLAPPASTASRPASVTIAIRPSVGWDGDGYIFDLGQRRSEIFLQLGLDIRLSESELICPTGNRWSCLPRAHSCHRPA
ncbi:MAG: hypothetical protein QOJ15_10124 [Bradyrhizobium sp.]|jgi:hypothetical protein|nr:hypothetical protein [Bradyrhizobium sp.]